VATDEFAFHNNPTAFNCNFSDAISYFWFRDTNGFWSSGHAIQLTDRDRRGNAAINVIAKNRAPLRQIALPVRHQVVLKDPMGILCDCSKAGANNLLGSRTGIGLTKPRW